MADGTPLTERARALLACDLFCGAGGTSTGAVRAAHLLGRRLRLDRDVPMVDGRQLHTAMHPDANHLCADLESVRPREVVPGGRLDLLMKGSVRND